MKEIQGRIKFGAIGIPSDSSEFEISKDYLTDTSLLYWNGQNLDKTCEFIAPYDNTFRAEIVGKISDLTEEQAAEFVEYYQSERVYRNYIGLLDEAWDCTTSKESLISLLKVNGIKTKEMADDLYDEVENLPDDLLLIKLQ